MKTFYSGDQPGEGLYQCNGCGGVVDVNDSTFSLLPCSECGCTVWIDRCIKE
ncbi:hypothetical protein MBCUT_19200 [Methanobrevibacter cuticularis]|uniref:Uncharacterized protein n=1 Tax=Methanobrevibacter cuticularis TaxID=47311 RepID=A0A166CRL2_9EURY|nr:hypothetical protein [Methanobrevibacter cuticularis]KZX14792.1 hypothetical protein MBCUT_19200 [Methanobrevibacter cuticularis]